MMMIEKREGNVLLIRLVEKGTRNVPSTVAQKEDCVCDDLLRMSCIIRLDHHSSVEDQQLEWGQYLQYSRSACSESRQRLHCTDP